jgi:serine/threonine protein kinase
MAWKLCDFGFTLPGTTKGFITTAASRGTSGYRAPELLREHAVYNVKTDIWALGCIIYEILNGCRLFYNDYSVTTHAEDSKAWTTKEWDIIGSAVTEAMVLMISIQPQERPSASRVLRTFEKLATEYRFHETGEDLEEMAEEASSKYVGLAQQIARTLHVHEETHGDDLRTADLLAQLGSELLRQGNGIEAQDILIRALGIYKDEPGANSRKISKTFEKMARVQEALGNLWGAIHFVEQAREIYDQLGELEEEHEDLINCLGRLYMELAEMESRQRQA